MKSSRCAVTFLALDHHFFDVAVIDVADGALDQVAVRVDQRRRCGTQRLFAQFVPQAGKIIEVALDLGLGALQPGGAHDAAHRARKLHFRDDRLQALAVRCRIDLAADAAAMAGIGHEHAVTASQAEVSGQRRALVAALFLDDLDEQHLAAMDHILDLVAAAQSHALGAQFVSFLRTARRLALTAATTAAPAPAFVFRGVFFVFVETLFDIAGFDDGNFVLFGSVDFGQAAIVIIIVAVVIAVIFVVVLIVAIVGAQGGLFLGVSGFFSQQSLTVFLGDLVVIRVNFAEREKPVTIAAKVNESCLERRLHAGHLRQVDIAFQLLAVGQFEIEFFNAISLEDRHPGFFRVARIDKHARCHYVISIGAAVRPDQPEGRHFFG